MSAPTGHDATGHDATDHDATGHDATAHDAAGGAAAGRPLLRVVRGAPDDAELAALVAVVASRLRAGSAERGPAGPASRWADPASRLGAVLPGPDAWRSSGWAGR